jgi:hypothetical protein
VTLGDRKLHALILPDRTVEDDALVRECRRLFDEPPSVADALGGYERALRVETVEDVAELRGTLP